MAVASATATNGTAAIVVPNRMCETSLIVAQFIRSIVYYDKVSAGLLLCWYSSTLVSLVVSTVCMKAVVTKLCCVTLTGSFLVLMNAHICRSVPARRTALSMARRAILEKQID
jgi:hypothetical protein